MMKWEHVRTACWLVIFVLAFSVPSLVAGPGSSSGEFLKISAFSRGVAVGGAWVAVGEGTGALYYNPAGIGRSGAGEVSVSHSELFQDLKLENLSVVYPLQNGSGVGFGLSYLGYGSIDGYDQSGNATGDIGAYSLLLSVGYSQRVSDNLSVGAVIKPVFEQLGGYSARTVTADVGLIADFGQFSFGAQLANWGGSIKFAEEKIGLPASFRFGMAYRTLGSTSLVSIGGSRESDGTFALNSGIEYHFSQSLTLRTGYTSTLQSQSNAGDGLSAGIGLNLQSLGIDYSYRPSGSLDGVHQITASYHFGK